MIKTTTIGDMISAEVKASIYASVSYTKELAKCRKQVNELEEYVMSEMEW